MNEAEEEEANWIATRIPEIASELALTSDNTMQEEEKRREIIESIASALRFMHRDKLSRNFFLSMLAGLSNIQVDDLVRLGLPTLSLTFACILYEHFN
jgi:hypothetical protein